MELFWDNCFPVWLHILLDHCRTCRFQFKDLPTNRDRWLALFVFLFLAISKHPSADPRPLNLSNQRENPESKSGSVFLPILQQFQLTCFLACRPIQMAAHLKEWINFFFFPKQPQASGCSLGDGFFLLATRGKIFFFKLFLFFFFS